MKNRRKSSRKKIGPRRKKAFIILVIASVVFILAVLAGAWWVFFQRTPSFTGDNVELTLAGPSETQVGELVTYTVTYANNENADLENVEISLIYPEGFSFSVASQSASNFGDSKWEIGTIVAGQSGSLSIKGNLFGDLDAEQICAASMTYQPTNVNSTFSEHTQAETKINSLDIGLEAKIPASVQKESEFEFPVKVTNNTQSDLANIRVKIDWPDKFELVSTSPAPRVSNTWDITKLAAGESEEIKIKGKITDEIGQADKIRVQVGIFDENDKFYLQQEQESDIKIVDISGELKLLVNNSEGLNANPGDDLDIIVSYKNTGTESLQDASVVLELDNSDLLDDVKVSQGVYQDGRIVWDTGGVKELKQVEPERAGALALKAKIISPLSVEELTDKNFSLKVTPKMLSKRSGEADVEITGNSVEVKINSEITLNAEARYNDHSGQEVGTGPMPPQVGKKTTYRVYLTLGNRTNEVSSGRIEIDLGEIAKWTGTKNVSVGDLKYEGGKVIWEVGRIPANTGQFTENLKANFELSITPRVADVGKTVELVKKSSFTGSDEFTSAKLTKESGSLDTELESDFISQGKGKVVE